MEISKKKLPRHDVSSLGDSSAVLNVFLDLSQSILGVVELEMDDFRFVFVSDATCRYNGYNPASIRGKTAAEMNLPIHIRKLWLENMRRCLDFKMPMTFEYERVYPQSRHYFQVSITFLRETEMGRSSFAYVAHDFTSLKEAQNALSESEKRFKLAQESVEMGSWSLNAETGAITWSPSMARLFGLPDGAAPTSQADFMQMIHVDDREDLAENIRSSFENVTPHRAEFRIVTKGGEIRWIEGRGHTLQSGDGQSSCMVGVAIDVTRRKVAEEMFEAQSANLMNLSKMSALGEMAGGIAHEINNPLTIIKANAALMTKYLNSGKPNIVELQKIATVLDATTARIASLIEGLHFFARDGSADGFVNARLNDIVTDTLSFCRERFKKHGIDLVVAPIPEDLVVECQPVQISQVILNLLNNAHDAVENAPVKRVDLITIKTTNAVQLVVKDSGPGVPPTLQGKIFRPFFTTKHVGKGTGLGLSIVKGIVESHAGTIIYKRHDGMTIFSVTLPAKRNEGCTK